MSSISKKKIVIYGTGDMGIQVFNIIKNHCQNLSYCPERIAQGKSLIELPKLSQFISGKNINIHFNRYVYGRGYH